MVLFYTIKEEGFIKLEYHFSIPSDRGKDLFLKFNLRVWPTGDDDSNLKDYNLEKYQKLCWTLDKYPEAKNNLETALSDVLCELESQSQGVVDKVIHVEFSGKDRCGYCPIKKNLGPIVINNPLEEKVFYELILSGLQDPEKSKVEKLTEDYGRTREIVSVLLLEAIEKIQAIDPDINLGRTSATELPKIPIKKPAKKAEVISIKRAKSYREVK